MADTELQQLLERVGIRTGVRQERLANTLGLQTDAAKMDTAYYEEDELSEGQLEQVEEEQRDALDKDGVKIALGKLEQVMMLKDTKCGKIIPCFGCFDSAKSEQQGEDQEVIELINNSDRQLERILVNSYFTENQLENVILSPPQVSALQMRRIRPLFKKIVKKNALDYRREAAEEFPDQGVNSSLIVKTFSVDNKKLKADRAKFAREKRDQRLKEDLQFLRAIMKPLPSDLVQPSWQDAEKAGIAEEDLSPLQKFNKLFEKANEANHGFLVKNEEDEEEMRHYIDRHEFTTFFNLCSREGYESFKQAFFPQLIFEEGTPEEEQEAATIEFYWKFYDLIDEFENNGVSIDDLRVFLAAYIKYRNTFYQGTEYVKDGMLAEGVDDKKLKVKALNWLSKIPSLQKVHIDRDRPNAEGGEEENNTLKPKDSKGFHSLLTAESVQSKLDELQADHDQYPLYKYGLGIEGYLDFTLTMAKNFCLWSVLAIVVCYIYYTHGALVGGGMYNGVARLSFGNFQARTNKCFQEFQANKGKTTVLSCSEGQKITEMVHFGIVAYDPKQKLVKVDKANDVLLGTRAITLLGNAFCGDPTHIPKENNCTSLLDTKYFIENFNKTCLGKHYCSLDLQGVQYDESDQVKYKKCIDKKTRYYIQIGCEAPQEKRLQIKYSAITAAFIILIICVYFFETIRMKLRNQPFQKLRNDIANCTIADYTIRVNFQKDSIDDGDDKMDWYKAYLNHCKNNITEDGKRKQDLKKFFVEEITRKVKGLFQVNKDKPVLDNDKLEPEEFEDWKNRGLIEDKHYDYKAYEKEFNSYYVDVEVATCTIQYKQGLILKELENRAQAATLKERLQIEERLNGLIKRNQDELARPISAFVTFTNQEAKERCVRYFYEKDPYTGADQTDNFIGLQSLGIELEVTDPSEPSDYMFENLEISDNQVKCNECKLYMYLAICVVFAFILFTFLKLKTGENQKKYPPTLNCPGIYNAFTTPILKGKKIVYNFTKEQKKRFAIYANLDKKPTEDKVGGGYYQCFCTQFQKMSDAWTDKALCHRMVADKYWGLFWVTCVSVLTQVVNYILAIITQTFCEYVGYDTLSQKYSTIMVCTFVAAYVNTALIPLFTNADLTFAPWPLNLVKIKMQYPDFTGSWWVKVGPSIVVTVLIQAFMPFIGVLITVGITIPFRMHDRGCCTRRKLPSLSEAEEQSYSEEKKDEFKKFIADHPGTLQKDIFDYVQLHAGPDYLLHTFYSKVLLIIFVTFTYGLMMPILFPICAFALFNMWFVDTLMLTYWYRRPPLYDDSLYKKALELCQRAIVPTFVLGYWIMSNQQIFNNVPMRQEYVNSGGNPKHPLIYFKEINQGHMALIIVGAFILRILIEDIQKCCKDCEGRGKKKDAETVEADTVQKHKHIIMKGKSIYDQKKLKQEEMQQHENNEKLTGFDWYNKTWEYDCSHSCWYMCCACFYKDDLDLDEMDEQLPVFWSAMNGRDQKNWFTQVSYEQLQLGVTTMQKDAFDNLQSTNRLDTQIKNAKTISSAVSYSILMNPSYQVRLRYLPVFDREIPEDSNGVKIVHKKFCQHDDWAQRDIVSYYFSAMDEIIKQKVRGKEANQISPKVFKKTGRNALERYLKAKGIWKTDLSSSAKLLTSLGSQKLKSQSTLEHESHCDNIRTTLLEK